MTEFEMRELFTSPPQAEALKEVCAIAYQCVGTLLIDAERFDSDDGDKLLTMLSDMKPDDTLLPFNSGKQVAELEKRIAELEKDAEIGKLVRSKMISGNDVPVERCHITRAEIDAFLAKDK